MSLFILSRNDCSFVTGASSAETAVITEDEEEDEEEEWGITG